VSGSTWTADRDLRLGELLNGRDMGGLELAGGGEIRRGALLRAECPAWSQTDVWGPLAELGVRTVVDLRAVSEPDYEVPAGAPIESLRRPFFGFELEAVLDEWEGELDVVGFYAHVLELSKGTIAAAARAVIEAPPGGVLVHCNLGKDRTGLLVALMLESIGGERGALAADYGLSSRNLAERLANWAGEGLSEHQKTMRRQLIGSGEEQLLAVLAQVDERYGGPRDYLLASGLGAADLDRLRARLS
jgi:hypothetical protein